MAALTLTYSSLFFFPTIQVVNSRRESDAGTYWCEAKNEWGIARSRNATLQVAGESVIFLLMEYLPGHKLD